MRTSTWLTGLLVLAFLVPSAAAEDMAAKVDSPSAEQAEFDRAAAEIKRIGQVEVASTVIVAWDPAQIPVNPIPLPLLSLYPGTDQWEWHGHTWRTTTEITKAEGWGRVPAASRPEAVTSDWRIVRFEIVGRVELYRYPGRATEVDRERLLRLREGTEAKLWNAVRVTAMQVAGDAENSWKSNAPLVASSEYRQLREESKRISEEVLSHRRRVQQIPTLLREREQMERDVRAKEGRMEAIGEQIAHIRARAQARAADDLIATELAKIVEIRQRAVDLMKAGLSSTQPEYRQRIDPLEAALAEAKIQLARRREALAEAAGGGLLNKLAAEQIMAKIDLQEMESRRIGFKEEVIDIRARQQGLHQQELAADRRAEQAYPWKMITIYHTDDMTDAAKPTTRPASP